MDWLDFHIKKQRKQRQLISGILGGRNAGSLQELAERENFDRPVRKKKRSK